MERNWDDWAEPIIEDVLAGWEMGVFNCRTREGFDEVRTRIAQGVCDAYGKEFMEPDAYSLVVGHIMGQMAERKRSRERETDEA